MLTFLLEIFSSFCASTVPGQTKLHEKQQQNQLSDTQHMAVFQEECAIMDDDMRTGESTQVSFTCIRDLHVDLLLDIFSRLGLSDLSDRVVEQGRTRCFAFCSSFVQQNIYVYVCVFACVAASV